MRSQPNILLIMPDQMRGDCLSIAGHPVLETPAMDSIGRQGTHFEAGFTTCASCVPARRSLLTGLHPSTNGMVGMATGYAIPQATLPRILSDNGYVTAMIGRYMHQSPYEEPYGFQTRILASTHVDDDEYATTLKTAVPELGSLRNLGVTFNGWGAKPWEYAEELHPTTWVTRKAREWLAGQDGEKPRFLITSFYAPHPPLLPPQPYFDHYYARNLPDPVYGDWNGESPGNAGDVKMDSHRVHLTGDPLRRAQAGYFGLIKHIDDRIAPLLREFKEQSEREQRPWIIALVSDHGEMLGDHNLYRKCEPYEGASRIPFLIQGSQPLGWHTAHSCATPVCLEDLMPTVLEAADIERPDHLDGRSLVPVLKGKTDRVREYLHGEHAPQYDLEQGYHFLTDGKMKYIWRPHNGAEQLFDRLHDPAERHDLSKQSACADILAWWRARMAATLNERPEGFSDGKQLFAGREYKKVLPFLEKHKG